MKIMNLNQAVFTTKNILQNNERINLVVHDQDDEWQFLDGNDVSMEDIMIVALKTILEYDDTIKEILNLDKNMYAVRGETSRWEIFPISED